RPVAQPGRELVDPGPVRGVVGGTATARPTAVTVGRVVDHQDRDLPRGRGGTDHSVHLTGDGGRVVLGEPGAGRDRGNPVVDQVGARVVRVGRDPLRCLGVRV